MKAKHPFKNRLRAYERAQKKMSSRPIPAGFAICPVALVAGFPKEQIAQTRQLYQFAYETARRNVIPFYLRPVLGTGN